MNFISLNSTVEFFEFWKFSARANVGFALGLHVRLRPWLNKTDDGMTLDVALGFVQLTLTTHANR